MAGRNGPEDRTGTGRDDGVGRTGREEGVQEDGVRAFRTDRSKISGRSRKGTVMRKKHREIKPLED